MYEFFECKPVKAEISQRDEFDVVHYPQEVFPDEIGEGRGAPSYNLRRSYEG